MRTGSPRNRPSTGPPPLRDDPVSDRPYLFPVPGHVLRSLLNRKAEAGDTFSEDEAAADIMLDLDRVAGGQARGRSNTGLPHAYSFYAKRWGWSKTRVVRGLAGEPKRGVEPWISVRATSFRSFFADRLGPLGTDSGPKQAPNDTKEADLGPLGTGCGPFGTGIEQTPETTKSCSPAGARAREQPEDADLPPEIAENTWREWCQHRREIRKPLKPTTVTHQLKQLAKWTDQGYDPNQIITRSIANGWTGLFEPDEPPPGGDGAHAGADRRPGSAVVAPRRAGQPDRDAPRGRPGTSGGDRRSATERAGSISYASVREQADRVRARLREKGFDVDGRGGAPSDPGDDG